MAVPWVWLSTALDGEALVLEIWGVLSNYSLLLLLGSLWPWVPVRVPFTGQIDLLKMISIRFGYYFRSNYIKCININVIL